MSNTVLLLDKQRYLGGVPKFQIWYRRAQEARNPLIKNYAGKCIIDTVLRTPNKTEKRSKRQQG